MSEHEKVPIGTPMSIQPGLAPKLFDVPMVEEAVFQATPLDPTTRLPAMPLDVPVGVTADSIMHWFVGPLPGRKGGTDGQMPLVGLFAGTANGLFLTAIAESPCLYDGISLN